MPDPFPKKRKAHVKRVYRTSTGSDGAQTVDTSTWVDMLRIDELPVEFRGLGSGKTVEVLYKFIWNDDPDNPDPNIQSNDDPQQEDANPARKTEKLEVKNPSDTDQIIEVYIVNKTPVLNRGGTQPGDEKGSSGQTVRWVFDNVSLYDGDSDKKPSLSRKVTNVRVVNNDLNGFELKSQSDDTKGGVLTWDDETEADETYLQKLKNGNRNEGQYLDVEVVDKFVVNFGAGAIPDLPGVKGDIQIVLAGNKVLDDKDSGLFKQSDENADTPPLRFDPLQVPVNYQSTTEMVLAYGGPDMNGNTLVCFKLKAGDSGKPEVKIDFSKQPYHGTAPAKMGDIDLGLTDIAEIHDIPNFDSKGNFEVSSNWDPSYKDIFYDKNGKVIDKMPKDTSTGSSSSRTDQKVIKSKTYNHDTVTSPDPIDARRTSYKYDSAIMVAEAADGSFVVLKTIGGIDNTGLSPAPGATIIIGGIERPPLVLTGTSVSSLKRTLIKYDKKGSTLWSKDLDNTQSTSVSGTSVNLAGMKGNEQIIVPWYATYYSNGAIGLYSYNTYGSMGKGYVSAACLGDFVLVAYTNHNGYFGQTKTLVDNWTQDWLHPEGGPTTVESYVAPQISYYIDIIDKGGAVVKTITWGSVVPGGFITYQPISYGAKPAPYHDPYPTEDAPAATGPTPYGNSIVTLKAKPF